MHQKYLFVSLISLACCLFGTRQVHAQHIIQPYSYSFYQKMNAVYYNADYALHTAIKPYALAEEARPLYDSIMNRGIRERNTWIERKLFNEHLFDVQKEDYTFFADFIPDFQIGRDFAREGKTLWLNTRGFQAGGTVLDKFYFYTAGYENQGVFPKYIDDYINNRHVVPGQMYGKIGDRVQDWTYVQAIVSYAVSEKFQMAVAYDKTHIGDGYRSMLLSDVSSNYTSLKFLGTVGDVQYLSQWSYMLDPLDGAGSIGAPAKHKWGAFQYADWNVDNRLSLGIFNSIVWGSTSDSLTTGSSAKVGIGVNARYKLLHVLSIYGQAYYDSKLAAQLGFRGYDAFGVNRLNYLVEYNTAAPYAYSSKDAISGYTNYSESLAHPFGANFNEWVGLLHYSYGRFDFSAQANYGRYGLDPTMDDHYGKDILKPVNQEIGSKIGQGVQTDLIYGSGKVAYVLNPKYNLRIEAGAALRQEKNELGKNNTGMLIFGLRASFRDFYYDF